MDKDSILDSIKKLHGISPEDTSFDTDIIIHINSALMTVSEIGVGPDSGFYIEDRSAKWTDIEPNKTIAETIASLVYVKVRLVFDPPASPTVVEALKSSADEYIWRLNHWVETH